MASGNRMLSGSARLDDLLHARSCVEAVLVQGARKQKGSMGDEILTIEDGEEQLGGGRNFSKHGQKGDG
jgi:hypothetical protein